MDDIATKDRPPADTAPAWRALAREKFRDPLVTAKGERRAAVDHPHCAKFCALGGASCSRG
jgi:hypothetical protein